MLVSVSLTLGVHMRYGFHMGPGTQSWLQLAVLLVGLGATLLAAISHHTHYIDKRIEDLRLYLDAKFEAIDARLERLEHPVSCP